MSPPTWNDLITILALAAAILAWAAKLRWSREFIRSKDEQIETLKSHLELLSEQVSPVLFENYKNVKCQLEEFNGELRAQLADAIASGTQKDVEIADLNRKIEVLISLASSAIKASEKTLESWAVSDKEVAALIASKRIDLGSVAENFVAEAEQSEIVAMHVPPQAIKKDQ